MQTLSGHTRQLFPSSPRRLNHACQNPGEGPLTANSRRTRRRHTFQHPPSSHSHSSRSWFKVSLQIRYLAYRFWLPPTFGMWLVLFNLRSTMPITVQSSIDTGGDFFSSIPFITRTNSSPPGLHFSLLVNSFPNYCQEIKILKLASDSNKSTFPRSYLAKHC